MIKELFTFLRDQLIQVVEPVEGTGGDGNVNFINLNSDPPSLTSRVNLLLINVEEEKQLRPPDPYSRIGENGIQQKVQPPYRLNLFVLFAAKPIQGTKSNYFNYPDALQSLSDILSFFQANPVFTPQRFPGLPRGLEKLIMELHSLSYSQQNEIWSALKMAYLPSVCYKAKMVVIQEAPAEMDAEVEEIQINSALL